MTQSRESFWPLKDLEFYYKGNVKALKVFKKGSDRIFFACFK